ncbi:MAG: glycosyltransferase family 9 protein [Candidatus Omnitrophica bacterium]|nr:glycosyltransferase family 9 protein [Candidatus Omnitrophota bacterium]
MDYNKILIINLGGAGDLLLSTPALKALRKKYPQSEICALVSQRGVELASSLPYLNKVFCFYINYGGSSSLLKQLSNIKSLLYLRKHRFDLAINMRSIVSESGAGKIKLVMDIISPKMKAGRNTQERGSFFDIKIPEQDIGIKPEMEYDIDTIAALGVKDFDRKIDLEIDKTGDERVKEILRNESVGEKEILVGIHPGGMPSRRWPAENFASLIKLISNEIDCKFVLTGDKQENGLVERISRLSEKKVVNLAGKLNFFELAALINKCNIFISNDTGPMHIAAVLDKPLVAIFGPGDIVRFDPRNISKNVIVVRKETAGCKFPCNKQSCDTLDCLKQIHPEEVLQAVFSLLNRK